MEKEIITFKRNSRLAFFEFFQIRWPQTAVQKCYAIIYLINTPLQMSRGIGT